MRSADHCDLFFLERRFSDTATTRHSGRRSAASDTDRSASMIYYEKVAETPYVLDCMCIDIVVKLAMCMLNSPSESNLVNILPHQSLFISADLTLAAYKFRVRIPMLLTVAWMCCHGTSITGSVI